SNKIKIIGWIIFAFYWSVMPKTLYFGEDGDFVNAFICIVGVYIFFYLAYHEWLSIERKEQISCLNWIAGASAIAGLIYYGIELTPLKEMLIQAVAFQSAGLLNFFTENVVVQGENIYYNGSYVVTIIFACTAVQSFVIFVGMIFALKKIKAKKILIGLLVTVVPVYFLNLIRNASIVYLLANEITDFSTAHNIIGKGGSLIALVILLLIVTKFIPEIMDEIFCLIDLPKRKGPLEKIFSRKK
ncbi:MAG TPA: archaeosortase A, partial [Bacteroidetes bacterium]|nr:archaeosortase A [Bacteroidota bacterium]